MSVRVGVLVSTVCACLALVWPAAAVAFNETLEDPNQPINSENCGGCHQPYFTPGPPAVHGAYSASSSKCGMCHTVHDAPEGGQKLLPAATIAATCFTCHDGTGGRGVYGTIAARIPEAEPAGHRVEVTSAVPGGDAETGGLSTMVFKGLDGALTCTDCHSTHGADTVEPFVGDRVRGMGIPNPFLSTKLLRRSPGGSDVETATYGSDWCLACHAGRGSAGAPMNHPVDSAATHADPFHYGRVALIEASGVETGVTVIGGMGGVRGPVLAPDPAPLPGGNRGFLMPYPRTPEQAGHAPICQQCHEDSREPGSLVGDGSLALVTPATITNRDGLAASDNPRFQNFPHETVNYRMLVTGSEGDYSDQLCMNCHPPAALP